MNANGERAFLGVAEVDGLGDGFQVDLVVDDDVVALDGETVDAAVGEQDFALGGSPLEVGPDEAVARLCGRLASTMRPFLLCGCLVALVRPEIEAVDGAVGEPHAAVVRVVVGLAGDVVAHGVVAADDGSVGGAEGVEVRLGGFGAEVERR